MSAVVADAAKIFKWEPDVGAGVSVSADGASLAVAHESEHEYGFWCVKAAPVAAEREEDPGYEYRFSIRIDALSEDHTLFIGVCTQSMPTKMRPGDDLPGSLLLGPQGWAFFCNNDKKFHNQNII